MSENTTPWVRSKIKPEKPGWYERLYRTEPPVTVVHRCYWDGMYWSLPDDEAHRSSDQDMRWRPIPDACEQPEGDTAGTDDPQSVEDSK